MKTLEQIKKEYPRLNDEQIQTLYRLHNMNGFLKDDKMNQARAHKVLTSNRYVYKNKLLPLKFLCEELVKEKITIDDKKVFIDEVYYELPKMAIDYIKHLQFENSIKEYYTQKQKEKSELIYVDLNKILKEEKGQ